MDVKEVMLSVLQTNAAVEIMNEIVIHALQSSRDMCTELREELDFKVGTGNATEAQMKDWESLVQDIAALNRVIDYYAGCYGNLRKPYTGRRRARYLACR